MAGSEGTASLTSSLTHNDRHEGVDAPESTASAPEIETASFAWEDADASTDLGLAPTNLPLAKVQRAWDRRPQSPFSKRRFKTGKIFKRNAPQAASVANAFASTFNVNIRPNGDGGTPVKAVKKMRIARDSPNGHGSASLVSDWECRGSPANRRIVTRSSLGKEELIALAEPEEEEDQNLEGPRSDVEESAEDVEGTSTEILNEDGTHRTADEDHSDDWEDESATEVEEDEEAEQQAWERCRQDARAVRESMSPSESIITSPWQLREAEARNRALAEDTAVTATSEPVMPSPGNAQEKASSNVLENVPEHASTSEPENKVPHEEPESDATVEPAPVATLPQEPLVLPDGFVSPAVVRRRRPISQVKQNAVNRRRTLPINFSSSIMSPEQAPARAEEQSVEPGHEADNEAEEPQSSHEEAAVTYQLEDRREDEEVDLHTVQDQVELPLQASRELTPEPTREPSTEPNTPSTESQLLAEYQRENNLRSPSRLPSSPVPTVEGSHPRLPLRRSPRRQRQSTSPVKRRSILKQALQRPHLVAFTPIKMPADPQPQAGLAMGSSPLPIDFAGITSPAMVQDELPVRSSSAPPEEPQMSPRKPKQPRISDDTALLEAFLKRASESKSGRRVSDAARRESLENRRHSGTIRQALASPAPKQVAPSDVLADLDPNSPSPRKSSGVSFSSTAPGGSELECKDDPIRDDEDELAAESGPPQKFSSRKSGRVKKKPETLPATTYDGKTKIQIKTNSEGVVLRKTEAQQLAVETRKNTRENKKGAILPPLRLTKMAAEKKKGSIQEEAEDWMDIEQAPVPGRRGIRWAETLVSFYEGDEPEISTMTDELNNEQSELDLTAQETSELKEADAIVVAAPPTSQAASKPKLRRLKPPKPTASTPAKPLLPLDQSLSNGEDEQKIEAGIKPKASTKRKVSRIATPAKVKGKTLLGQEDDDGEEQARLGELKPRPTPMPSSVQKLARDKAEDSAALSAPTKAVASSSKKKAVATSKLPAPAPPSMSHANTGLAAGKENSLIASPPKKRTTKGSTMAAAPPLKLGEAKGLAPKFDLSKAAALKPAETDNSAAFGISSPAKKAPRMMPARSTVSNERRQEMEVAPGLASPAKKRTRRMVN